MHARAGGLLERDTELERAAMVAAGARGGAGRVLAVVGAAGIGKTELLNAVAERARGGGMTVLRARAAELERDLPFGVARQLFEPAVARSSAEDREALLSGAARLAAPIVGGGTAESPLTAPDASFAAMHGLYWVCANLAAGSPLALVVDDLHWCDPPSLGWINYLSRRLGDLPVLLALSFRPAETDIPLLDELLGDPAAEILRPRPLSTEAVAKLLARTLQREPHPDFARACHQATNGNPHLLRELAAVADAERIEPSAENAARVLDLTPETVQRAVLARTARFGPSAVAVTRAVALLNPHAEPATVAALAGLDDATADAAVDALAKAEILRAKRPLEFIHPLVRTVLYRDMGPAERARGHAEAARRLAATGAEPGAVAGQLLAAEPRGDPWAVQRLRDAAADALARAAPEAAATFLRRALQEPPPPELRRELLAELGAAEVRAGHLDALQHLAEALELADDPGDRARAALRLAQAQFHAGMLEASVRTCDEAIERLAGADPELELELEGRAGAAIITGPLSARARERLQSVGPRARSAATPAERALLAAVAMEAVSTGERPVREPEELARRALAGGRLLEERGPDDPAYAYACSTLIWCGRYDLAIPGFDRAAAEARRRGSAIGTAQALTFRGGAAYMSGDVRASEADVRTALGMIPPGSAVAEGIAWGFLLHSLIERGELAEAAVELERSPLAGEIPNMNPFHVGRLARGRLLAAQGRLEEALTDLTTVREQLDASGFSNPGALPWKTETALVQARLGRRDAALELVSGDLVLAKRFAAPRGIGVALRVKGLLAADHDRIELLREAARVLAGSQDRLEYARSLVDLGAELRRGGQAADAREPLRDGLELARRCGATALVARAYDELEASGLRQRRILQTGVDALTASERRVAQMAAEGMTNADIAQALFLSVRTVETHLRHAYQKLDIESRAELPAALAPPE